MLPPYIIDKWIQERANGSKNEHGMLLGGPFVGADNPRNLLPFSPDIFLLGSSESFD